MEKLPKNEDPERIQNEDKSSQKTNTKMNKRKTLLKVGSKI